jgi:ubiquitin-conjugating enzyme E2 Q
MSSPKDVDDTNKEENDVDDNKVDDHDDDDDNDEYDDNDDDYYYGDEIDDYDYHDDNDVEKVENTPYRQQAMDTIFTVSILADKEKSSGKLRIAKDLIRIMNHNTNNKGYSLRPTNDDCLDEWTIHLFCFDQDEMLAKDMLVCGIRSIELSMTFPESYPFEPPFVRVVKPRFVEATGFVFKGALCMELLTKVSCHHNI